MVVPLTKSIHRHFDLICYLVLYSAISGCKRISTELYTRLISSDRVSYNTPPRVCKSVSLRILIKKLNRYKTLKTKKVSEKKKSETSKCSTNLNMIASQQHEPNAYVCIHARLWLAYPQCYLWTQFCIFLIDHSL